VGADRPSGRHLKMNPLMPPIFVSAFSLFLCARTRALAEWHLNARPTQEKDEARLVSLFQKERKGETETNVLHHEREKEENQMMKRNVSNFLYENTFLFFYHLFSSFFLFHPHFLEEIKKRGKRWQYSLSFEKASSCFPFFFYNFFQGKCGNQEYFFIYFFFYLILMD